MELIINKVELNLADGEWDVRIDGNTVYWSPRARVEPQSSRPPAHLSGYTPTRMPAYGSISRLL